MYCIFKDNSEAKAVIKYSSDGGQYDLLWVDLIEGPEVDDIK